MVTKGKGGENGFSLLEFAIVLTLLGLFIGGAIALYGQYRERDLIERNANAILNMQEAINGFMGIERRLPCPAPLNAKPGDADYGIEMDCANTAAGDYRRIPRPGMDPDGDGTLETMYIREGTFPFMTMRKYMRVGKDKPGGSDVVDAYGRQFTYVVTERQATDKYMDNGGAILLKNEHGRDVARNADVLLISHGANGAGARAPDGTVRRACDETNGRDRENCNGDFTYLHGLQFRADGPNYNDDQTIYAKVNPPYLWEQISPGSIHVHNLNPGKVGIGTKAATDQLHIKDGNLLAYRFEDNYGDTKTNSICTENGVHCFAPELIGGDIFPQCPADQIMIGIKDGRADCVQAYNAPFSSTPCGNGGYIGSIRYSVATKSLVTTCKCPVQRRNGPCL